MRASYSLERVRSKRRRRERERRLLDDAGWRAQVFELQGDLVFAATEAAVRAIVAASERFDVAIVDFRRVDDVDGSSGKLLLALCARLRDAGKQTLLSGIWRHKELERLLIEALVGEAHTSMRTFLTLDQALEAAEGHLIMVRSTTPPGAPQEVALAEHDLLRGLSPTAAAAVQARLKFLSFRRGEMLVRQGDTSGDLFLITKGEVSVVLELDGGQAKRLSTLSAGMTFGELTALTGAARTADVRADTAVECYVLPKAAWDSLTEVSATARMGLLENMLRSAAALAMSLTAEVAALEG